MISQSYVTKSEYPDDLRLAMDRFKTFLACNDEQIRYNADDALGKMVAYQPFKFKPTKSKLTPAAKLSWAVDGPLLFWGLQVKELSTIEKGNKKFIVAVLRGDQKGLPQDKRHNGRSLIHDFNSRWEYQPIFNDVAVITCGYRPI